MDGEKKGDGEKKKEEGEEKKKEDEGGEKRKDEKGGKKEQADSSDVSKPGMSSDRESITKRDSELAGVKSTPVADQGSFFGRMRARWQEAETRVREGECIAYHRVPWAEPAVRLDRLRVLFSDASLVVLSKPSGLPVLPSEVFWENTVLAALRLAFSP